MPRLGRILDWAHVVLATLAVLLALAIGTVCLGLAGWLASGLIQTPTAERFTSVALISVFGIGYAAVGAWGSLRALQWWRHWWTTRP